jgi:serine/threonine-protein kinase
MSTELTARSEKGPLLNGRYELVRPLGRGASATVFECRELPGGVTRALKLLHQEADEALLRSEFTRLSRWSHPHLVRVHDLDRLRSPVRAGRRVLEAGRLFLVMDLVRGEDPLQVVARTPARDRDGLVRRVADGLARALAFLHGHRVLHHDVKPANVLLAEEDGHALLLDLGLAARAGVGTTRGTPLYLAPEALAGAADFRSDLWSLGATLFHLVEGRPPFSGQGSELVRRILEEDPRPSALWLSADLRELILALLRKDPTRRPASARSVLAELARSQGDHRAVAELSSRPELLPPALVGREAQLERVAVARSGGSDQPRVLLLAGQPGCG